MFRKSHLKGLTSVLGSISVLGCSSLNCVLANDDETKSKEKNILKWEDLIEDAKKDAGWRWYLYYILSLFGFIEKGSLVKNEKILDTLVNKLKQENSSSEAPYYIKLSEIYEKNSTILFDSFNCLGLKVPERVGEKINFKGYDLVAVRYMFGEHRESALIWVTMGKNGNPVFLYPSGEVDEAYNVRKLDVEKIKEVLPGMYNESELAYRSAFDYIYKKFGEEVESEVNMDVELSLDEIKEFSMLFYYIFEKDGKPVWYDFDNYSHKVLEEDAQGTKFKLYGLKISKKKGTHQFFFKDSKDRICDLFFDLDGKDPNTTGNKRNFAICSAPKFCELLKSKYEAKTNVDKVSVENNTEDSSVVGG